LGSNSHAAGWTIQRERGEIICCTAPVLRGDSHAIGWTIRAGTWRESCTAPTLRVILIQLDGQFGQRGETSCTAPALGIY